MDEFESDVNEGFENNYVDCKDVIKKSSKRLYLLDFRYIKCITNFINFHTV